MLDLMTGKLILCATPIGNLGDTSARLATELTGADLIYAEDTRRAATLLQALDVRTKTRSYFVGNEAHRSEELAARLRAGDTVALITDAGMPAISDPGLSAVRVAREVGADVTVIPGPSAVTTALAVSGLPSDRFVFEGFLPRKGRDRSRRLAELATEERTVVLFSAKSRIADDLTALADALAAERRVVVARELTKAFEEIWAGTLMDAATHWADVRLRGEFTLVIAGAEPQSVDLDTAVERVRHNVKEGISMKDAVRQVATQYDISRRELYEAVLRSEE
jgi:16S rRNA (cytidine1402-2'-O)-methyltransferase